MKQEIESSKVISKLKNEVSNLVYSNILLVCRLEEALAEIEKLKNDK